VAKLTQFSVEKLKAEQRYLVVTPEKFTVPVKTAEIRP
jgi:hypothetical protein